ncbi:glutathione hydrolase 1 proenzyme-like [Aphidius gifuensis]|uniref:glutathione hydrolase 1 proenzyme-like n=1 Tax=Aphidius gifuensis TaxID=684658 RepID=UPI001CDC1746|nr:glutathione hydrolase 1 proenzyme-like [Aphidius gifuensis]
MKYGQSPIPFTTTANLTFDEKNNYILDFGNVNSETNLCSKMGRWILKKNGSAVDSAITTMICNGIMTPSGLGIGGGFLMTIYDRKNKQAHFLNAKDKAPIASHKNIFEEDVEELSKIGSLAIGVPGEVAGYWEAHQKFGKLAWFDLFEPNIQLCEKQSSSDRNIRPQFCDTIRTIAEKGANEFYNGTIGKKLIEDLNKLGSIMTIEDLKNYRVKWTDPIVNDFLNGTKLFTSNLPGSGGLLVLIIIETWKYAYAIRSQMGDPDFTDMTDLIKNITSKDFARMIKDKIDHDKRTFNDPSHYGGGKNLVKDYGTSHMSIIAPNGDAVAVTSSLNGHFGSGEIIINTYSLPGVNKNNEIEGGKRPLSSMVPSIITTSNGDVRMVIGAAGGTQITTSVSYVIARHLFMDESIQKAITAPRIHHQLYPKELSTDEAISQKISNGLENMGHVIGPYATASSVIALVQINGTVIDHLDS